MTGDPNGPATSPISCCSAAALLPSAANSQRCSLSASAVRPMMSSSNSMGASWVAKRIGWSSDSWQQSWGPPASFVFCEGGEEFSAATAVAQSVMRHASSVWKAALVALVRRREPRGSGSTQPAPFVVLYALSVLFGIGAEAPPSGPRLSDFVIHALWLSFPVAVALVQLRR